LEKCYLLEAALFTRRKMDWFVVHGYVCKEAALDLNQNINKLIKEISPHSFELCQGYGIPEHTLWAPIYTGYQEYYNVDQTGGEHHNLQRAKF
jgi:hypothetical protein